MSDEQPDTTPTAESPTETSTAEAAAETPAKDAAVGATAEDPAAGAAEQPAASGALPKQAVFRMPRIAIMAAVLAMIAGTPLAWSSWWLASIYLVPIGFIVWVLRNRTVVDADGLTARRTFTQRTIGWDRLTGLKITKGGTVRATLSEDQQVTLPAVRTRHLPVLAAFSGGRIGNLRPPETAGTT